jgi:hypothetical protein
LDNGTRFAYSLPHTEFPAKNARPLPAEDRCVFVQDGFFALCRRPGKAVH